MASLELEGKISVKEGVQSGQGARGVWRKQNFVLEYQDGNYPAQAYFTSFGDNAVAELDKYQVGDYVKVSFNLRAREYNGRWFNDVRVWRISPAGQSQPSAGAQPGGYQPSGYHQPAAPQPPAPTIDDMPADDGQDDLPF